MVLEVDCQHPWLYMTYMKNFCKTQRKGLPLVLYSMICLRPLIPLITRCFYGSWNIFMGLEDYHTNSLLVICKTDSSILLLRGIGLTTQGVSLGVPQGSSQGPLFFALYVNDLQQASNLTPTLFADDTLLTIACANSTNLQNGVNNELQKVDEWMRYNKLHINYSKTTYMLLNSKLSQSCNFNAKINDNKIKHTTCTKYLGMYIDQHFSWTDHIHNLEIKLSRSVAMLYRIRYYLSNNALRSVYYSLKSSPICNWCLGWSWKKNSFASTECFT